MFILQLMKRQAQSVTKLCLDDKIVDISNRLLKKWEAFLPFRVGRSARVVSSCKILKVSEWLGKFFSYDQIHRVLGH